MKVLASCMDASSLSSGGQWGAVVVASFAVFLLFDIVLTVYTINMSVRKAEVKTV